MLTVYFCNQRTITLIFIFKKEQTQEFYLRTWCWGCGGNRLERLHGALGTDQQAITGDGEREKQGGLPGGSGEKSHSGVG